MYSKILRNIEHPDQQDDQNETDNYKQWSEYMILHAMHLPVSDNLLYCIPCGPDCCIIFIRPTGLICLFQKEFRILILVACHAVLFCLRRSHLPAVRLVAALAGHIHLQMNIVFACIGHG